MTVYLHPGVYLAEVPFASHPIEGVHTSTAGLYGRENAPQWTDAQPHDPGVTPLEQFAWLGEIAAYRLHGVPPAPERKALSALASRSPDAWRSTDP